MPKILRIVPLCSIHDPVHTHRNITYRLVPGTAVRARKLASTAGACRYVWNTVLADQQGLYLSARAAGAEPPSVSFFTLGQAYTQLRRVTPWLQELPFAPIRYTLKYQADAWQRLFRGQGGRPRFKARRGDDRVTFPGGSFRIEGDVVRLARIGPMRLRRRGGNPYPDGVPKQVAVKRVGRRWHAVVCYEVEVGERPDDGRALGIDMNVGQVTTSDGAILRQPVSSMLMARHRRQQRVAARRRKGSRRRLRMVRRAARTARKLAMRRRNWQHQMSRRLADRAATLVVEDLRVRGMTASARGTVEQPGTNVQQKAGLNRSILHTGWGDLRRMLEYKAATVVAVNPAYSSQTCHACGHVSAASRPCQAQFKCVSCGHTAHADVNAARNILALGTGATGRRGALALATPQTRQPVSEAA